MSKKANSDPDFNVFFRENRDYIINHTNIETIKIHGNITEIELHFEGNDIRYKLVFTDVYLSTSIDWDNVVTFFAWNIFLKTGEPENIGLKMTGTKGEAIGIKNTGPPPESETKKLNELMGYLKNPL